ncbi:hypothetical protein SRABI128_01611 [Microbacterium sp. Bi128]|nr:hypothetical protein SRABI128_01611 [Microbacterium sp. Bi128]
MDLDVPAVLGLDLVELRGDLLDRLVEAGVGLTEDRDDADGVLVDVLLQLEAVEHEVLLGDGHVTGLNVPVVAELLPHHLHAGREHEVRQPGRLALGGATLLPQTLQRETAEHAGLGGADRRGTDGVVGVGHVPQIGQDSPAAILDGRRGGVLVLVDHVLVGGLGVEPLRVVIHPRRHEGGEVQARVPVEHGLVVHQLIGGVARHHVVGHLEARERRGLAGLREDRVDQAFGRARLLLGIAEEFGHGLASCSSCGR